MTGGQNRVIVVTGAGGGQAYRVQLFQSKGVTFAEVPSIAQVAARWNEIIDMTSSVPGTNPVG